MKTQILFLKIIQIETMNNWLKNYYHKNNLKETRG